MAKEDLIVLLSKIFLVSAIILSLGVVLGVAGFLAKKIKISSPLIKIEISENQKSIINAETKTVIFTIEDTKKYLDNSGYAYNPDTFQDTNEKYAGDCFLSAGLSNNKNGIVFSTGCLAGDLPQPWIGVYNFPPDHETYFYMPFSFLTGGSGRNLIWSADDKIITYEADLGLFGITETRMIDSQTGEILKREIKSTVNTSDWLTYNSISAAESYSEEYKLKYPRNLFYETERAKGTHELGAFFKSKPNKLKFDVEVLSGTNDGIAYNSQNYYASNVKIGNNDFQELKDKSNENIIYIYKLDYKDNLSDNYHIVFRFYENSAEDREILLTALGTFQFLGNGKQEAIIGATEGSWKKVFKSEKYGFQMKYQNGLSAIDNLDDLSLIFVDGMGMYGNISLIIARLSGVSTAEEWMDRELAINENAPKKSDREYYRIGDSEEVGIMVNQADESGAIKNRAFYAARGQYLYAIRAPLIGTNEFAYYRLVSNFEFFKPKYKLVGLRSKWVIDNVFEVDENTGKLGRILNEKDFSEKGYQWKDVKWYETKKAGIAPEEIKSFFPATVIAPQGLLSANDWKKYQSKDKMFEFMLPKEWEQEAYSSEDTLFFNVNKSRTDNSFPKLTIMIGRNPVPIETLSIVGDIQIMKFNDIESIITSMYGAKSESDLYSYASGAVNYFVEFHSGARDYYVEADFKGGDYNKNIQTLLTILSSMRFFN